MSPDNTVLVRGRRILTDPEDESGGWIEDSAIAVQGNIIHEIGDFETLSARYPGAKVAGDGTHLVMPGLIDAHSHGHGLSRIQAGVFFDFLENMILDWPWRVALPSDLAAALTAVRHLRKGFTTIHHFGWDDPGPGAIEAGEKAVRAYLNTGIRLAYNPAVRNINRFACDEREFLQTLPEDLRALATPFTDYDSEKLEDDYFELFEHLYSKFDGANTRVLLGPSWAHGCTPKLLKRVKERADELGKLPIHMHCLQTPHQRAYGLMKHGKSLLAWLDEQGLVDSNNVYAHMVWASEDDVALLAERGASTTHHASCNFHVRNGIAPLDALLKAGINVAIGIDDKSINDDDDPFMEMRLIHKL
ncbi:MAG: amidohydrolase family protein, partial [Rhodospirillales bacterium]|nr:amidohydrolase family protein [Rhodospirillales bacterium]